MHLLRLFSTGTLITCLFAAPVFAAATIDEYDIINGSNGSFNYHDHIYTINGDGLHPLRDVTGASLSGGRGKLTDGELGTDNIVQNIETNNTKEWVGWHYRVFDESLPVTPPSITIKLNASQALSEIDFRTANSSPLGGGPTGDVAAFVSANISYSDDGVTFTTPVNEPVTTDPGPQSRWIALPLTGTHQYIRADLVGSTVPEKEWIFVSEIAVNLPEPCAVALVAMGVCGLIARRRGG